MAQKANDSAVPSGRDGRWLRAAGWVAGTGVVLGALLWFGLPVAIRYGVESWLVAQGATRASIGRIELGWWSARIELDDLRMAAPGVKDQAVGRIAASMELPPLLERRVLLRELVLEGVDVAVERGADGTWRVGGLVPGGGAQRPGTADADGWGFGVRTLELRRARLAVRAFGIDDTITVDRLRFANLVSWEASNPLTLEADLGLGPATLGARGSARPFGAEREARVDIDAAAVPLATLAPLLQRFGLSRLGGQARVGLALAGTDRGGDAGMRLSLAGSIGIDRGSVDAGGTRIGLDGLGWRGEAALDLGADGALDSRVDGQVSTKRVDIRSGDVVVGADAVDWKSVWQVRRAAGVSSLGATTTGGMTAQAFRAAGGGASVRGDSLRWDGKTDIAIDTAGRLSGRLDGALAIGLPQGEGAGVAVGAGSATWEGSLAASRAGRDGLETAMTAVVSADDLAVAGERFGLKGAAGAAGWSGRMDLKLGGAASAALGSAEGRVTLRNATLDDTKRGLRLAAARRASVAALSVGAGGDLAAREVDMEGLSVLAPLGDPAAGPALTMRSLAVDRIGFVAGALSIGEARLDDATLTAAIGEDRRLAALAPFLADADGAPAPAGESGKDPATRIEEAGPLRVGGTSRVIVEDRAQSPPFRIEFEPVTLSVGRIAVGEPAADVPVALDAVLRPHTKLSLNGTVRPFASQPTLTAAARIGALDLAPLSRYAEGWLGYALRTGQFNGRADLRIDDGRIAGEARLDLRGLGLEPLESGGEELEAALPVTLPTALDLLRDDNNRIRVTIPVSGDIGDPKFDLTAIIDRAIGRAISDAMMTTLKILFPIGALAAAVIDEVSADSELRFSPLGFAPGSAALDGDARVYLDQLAELLAGRPRIRINLCGTATESDRVALGAVAGAPTDPRLTALAEARAEGARGYLVTQRGIQSRRLPNCRPSLDRSADAKPRLDVLL